MTDFYEVTYRLEQPRTDSTFGILDGVGENPAFTTINKDKTWIATVHNASVEQIQFVAVDKNIPLYTAGGVQAQRCDGMMFYPDKPDAMILFMELKAGKTRNKRQWIAEAIEQLVSTIDFFKVSANWKAIVDRRAYVCNGVHPLVREFSMERTQRFYDKTEFKLIVHHEVDIALA